MVVCIRGAGKVGEKCKEVLEYSGNSNYNICFSDMEKSKYVNFRLPVYSIDESIELYNKGKIDFFIIPMAYHEEYQESMIRDLLENGIHVTDILLFPVKVTEKIKIDKLMNLREFEQYYPQWENKHGIERKKEIITEYNPWGGSCRKNMKLFLLEKDGYIIMCQALVVNAILGQKIKYM